MSVKVSKNFEYCQELETKRKRCIQSHDCKLYERKAKRVDGYKNRNFSAAFMRHISKPINSFCRKKYWVNIGNLSVWVCSLLTNNCTLRSRVYTRSKKTIVWSDKLRHNSEYIFFASPSRSLRKLSTLEPPIPSNQFSLGSSESMLLDFFAFSSLIFNSSPFSTLSSSCWNTLTNAMCTTLDVFHLWTY